MADRRETKVEAVKQQLSALAPVSGVWIKRMEAGAGASLEVETQLAAAELAQILVSDIAGWQIHAVTGRTVILGSPSSATTGIAAAMVEPSANLDWRTLLLVGGGVALLAGMVGWIFSRSRQR